jgi:hypothetical protein
MAAVSWITYLKNVMFRALDVLIGDWIKDFPDLVYSNG